MARPTLESRPQQGMDSAGLNTLCFSKCMSRKRVQQKATIFSDYSKHPKASMIFKTSKGIIYDMNQSTRFENVLIIYLIKDSLLRSTSA